MVAFGNLLGYARAYHATLNANRAAWQHCGRIAQSISLVRVPKPTSSDAQAPSTPISPTEYKFDDIEWCEAEAISSNSLHGRNQFLHYNLPPRRIIIIIIGWLRARRVPKQCLSTRRFVKYYGIWRKEMWVHKHIEIKVDEIKLSQWRCSFNRLYWIGFSCTHKCACVCVFGCLCGTHSHRFVILLTLTGRIEANSCLLLINCCAHIWLAHWRRRNPNLYGHGYSIIS